MRTRVELLRCGRTAIVTTTPSRRERWGGAAPDVRFAVAVPGVRGGLRWLWDGTGREIEERDVVAELERQRRVAAGV